MPKKINIDNEYLVIEECPNCSESLEQIMNEEDYVESFYCSKCSQFFNLDDLKIVEFKTQKSILDF